MNKTNIQKEGSALLFGLRLMTEEEQKIAFAMLEGMRLQKSLDAQRQRPQRETQPASG